MEERKWENLNEDCLVNVFERLDLETLLLDIPVVCKQWHHALLNPLCWQKLVFPINISRSRLAYHAHKCGGSFNISGLIKFVVDRSNGCATTLVLPQHTTKEDLIYVSDVCPFLKTLSLPMLLDDYGDDVSELFVKWKSLEVARLRSSSYMLQIINKISLHCKNIVGLSVAFAHIDCEIASTIVSKLSTIKCLDLNNASLEKEHLKVILLGCKKLELLYVRNCVGFDEDDEEIMKLASRINDFKCDGSRIYPYEDDDHISHDELVYGDYNSD